MTGRVGAAAPSDAVVLVDLEADAHALAEAQRHPERARRLVSHLFAPPAVARPLERAEKHLAATASDDATLSKAAEWFLDNYYLIRRVARQVEEELPAASFATFRSSRPVREGPAARSMCWRAAVVASASMTLDLAVLRRFIDAYQEVSPLTIAELWALPTHAAAAVLAAPPRVSSRARRPRPRAVRRASGRDRRGQGSLSIQPEPASSARFARCACSTSSTGRCFSQKTNRVEAILRTDPAAVYARMDFETCDAYRKVVEALAWDTGRAEEDVAKLAVTLSRDDATGERRGHVGYYLMGEGRRVLEQRLGYRADGSRARAAGATSWPTTSYLLPLALLDWGPVLALASYVARTTGPDGSVLVALAAATLVAVVPASAVAITRPATGVLRASCRRARCRSSTSPTGLPATREPSS